MYLYAFICITYGFASYSGWDRRPGGNKPKQIQKLTGKKPKGAKGPEGDRRGSNDALPYLIAQISMHLLHV